jgi:large subunit ribosomal protein L9
VEIILLERIPKLGELGDKVRVKPGFARNYLIPGEKALPATAKNMEIFEAKRAELEAISRVQLQKAKDRAALLEGLMIVISANAGEEGRLFGSVGAHEIVDAIKALGHEVAKNEVQLKDGPIREVGEYEVDLELSGSEVIAKIRVQVLAS